MTDTSNEVLLEENTATDLIVEETAAEELPNPDFESVVEAILFAAGHPMTYEQLGNVLQCSQSYIRERIQKYALEYNGTEASRGVMLLAFDDCCQLCTKAEYLPYIREALGSRRGGNLSNSSIETLAIIAYNQPVTRSFVDQVRGVDSSYAMNSLIDKALIEACGRLDAPGRPMLYATTEKFLRVFGLRSLSELPETEVMIPKQETPVLVEDDGQLSIDEDDRAGENSEVEQI